MISEFGTFCAIMVVAVPNLFQTSHISLEHDPHLLPRSTDDVMLITSVFSQWASPRGRVASWYQILCKYF